MQQISTEKKNWLDWVGKMIHWELCKKLKFDHTYKWYMLNSEYILENETRKLFWDFDKEMDRLISARRPDFIIINTKKEKLGNCEHFCPRKPLGKIEKESKTGSNTWTLPGN